MIFRQTLWFVFSFYAQFMHLFHEFETDATTFEIFYRKKSLNERVFRCIINLWLRNKEEHI